MESVTVKIETEEDSQTFKVASASESIQNGHTNSHESVEKIHTDKRNFSCLLCDVVCKDRDNLRKHLKDHHSTRSNASYKNTSISTENNESSPRAISANSNYRYSCALCGVKFKSFKRYLTHGMSHQRTGSKYMFSGLDENRTTTVLGDGKQYIKDYIDSEVGYVNTFSCDECKTVFLYRDAYAMHMMMRAMNQRCKPAENIFHCYNNLGENSSVVNGTSSLQSDAEDLSISRENHDTLQRCLEDVTSSVDQDEYLKSVLDKVCLPDSDKRDTVAVVKEYGKGQTCSFCGGIFCDQDALAMHVMSDHANAKTSFTRAHEYLTPSSAITQTTAASNYMSWLATIKSMAMAYVCSHCNETFRSREILAMHVLCHTHFDTNLIEKSGNSYKRHFPTNHSDVSSVGKKSRFSTATNGVVVHEKCDDTANGSLFCKLCNITFYATSEYKWHMDKHEQMSIQTNTSCDVNLQPQTYSAVADKGPENDPLNHEQTAIEAAVRLRRNSASFLTREKSTDSDILPQRPVSLGEISVQTQPSFDPEHSETLQNGHCSTPDSEDEGDKLSDLKNVLSSVQALSTNERRIIYSVFGKDLGLKLPVNQPEEQQEYNVEDSDIEPTRAQDQLNLHKNESSIAAPELLSGLKLPSVDKENEIRGPDAKSESNEPMCKYCEIVFFNKAIYFLHMGLHNVNNHWQCNVCGKVCKDAVDFAAHVIHM